FRPQLHRYCRKLTGDVWDAEDLVQETLLRAFATLGSVYNTIANPRGYLTRIATNIWLDGERRRTAEKRSLSLQVPETQNEPTHASDVRHAGTALLEILAPRERAAILLKEVFDLSLKETAEMLATSENAVKAALHRGRTRLKEEPPVRRSVA